MIPRLLATFVVLVTSLLISSSAVTAGELSDRAVEQFEQHVVTAAEARSDGDYETAIEHFQAAIAIADRPRLHLEVADAYTALDDCLNAEQTLHRLLDHDDADDALEQAAQRRLETIGDCPVDGRLAVECTPSDALITVELRDGGRSIKEAPCPVRWTVPPGDYTVVGTGEDRSTDRRDVSIAPNEMTRTSLTLISPGDDIADDRSAPTHWSQYASYGALGAGTLLVSIAGISDRNAPRRLQELRNARDAGDQAAIDQWTEHNASIRRRNFILYGSGAALLIGGGAALTWNLMGGPDSQQDQPVFGLQATPTEIQLRLKW